MTNKTQKLNLKTPAIPDFGILAASHSHKKDFKTTLHAHCCTSLFYVVTGKGILNYHDHASDSQKSLEISTDNAILLKPNIAHQIIDKPHNPMTLFVIYISNEFINCQLELNISSLYETAIHPGPYVANEIRKLLRKILNEQSQKIVSRDLAITISLTQILLELARVSSQAPSNVNSKQQRVQTLLEYIKYNSSQPYSLPKAAEQAKISERQFTNLCRKITGQSFRKYIENIRINKAAKLLKTTNMPAAAIAFEVGYEELSTFYRAFKSHFKTSPIAFRSSY